jgi:hypothetical protein
MILKNSNSSSISKLAVGENMMPHWRPGHNGKILDLKGMWRDVSTGFTWLVVVFSGRIP